MSSLLFGARPVQESRAVSMVDWGQGNDVSSSGSMLSSLSVVPVFAATRLIVDSVSGLPLQQFRKSGDERQPVALSPLFSPPFGRVSWVQQALFSLLLRGNAVGLAAAAGGDSETPTRGVRWLNPEHVTLDEFGDGRPPVYRYMGKELPLGLVRHIPAYSLPGSRWGVSPIGACSLLGSTGTSAQRMMDDWFKGRALPGATFQNTSQKIDPVEADDIGNRLTARLRHGKTLVYGSDWDFKPVSLSASDAAFIDAAKLNATQIASIYGIPPEMIGGETGSSLTYSTVELNTINFATMTLRPWLVKLEEAFSSWLPQPQFVRFNIDAMIRVDTRTRFEVHQIARTIGVRNVDEIRALEDLPPLPDGQGQDYTPLKTGSGAVAGAVKETP